MWAVFEVASGLMLIMCCICLCSFTLSRFFEVLGTDISIVPVQLRWLDLTDTSIIFLYCKLFQDRLTPAGVG